MGEGSGIVPSARLTEPPCPFVKLLEVGRNLIAAIVASCDSSQKLGGVVSFVRKPSVVGLSSEPLSIRGAEGD